MADLSLSKARAIVRGTLKHAREAEFNPLCVVVLDAGGHVRAVEREDDARPGRFEVAFGKAYGVAMTGMPGSALTKAAVERPFFVQALNGAFGGKLVPVAGGVLIFDKRGRLAGAVGVSGDTSDNDAAAAMAGIEAAGFTGEA